MEAGEQGVRQKNQPICVSATLGAWPHPGGCVGRKREDLASGLSEEQDRGYERSEASLTLETLFIPLAHLQGK